MAKRKASGARFSVVRAAFSICFVVVPPLLAGGLLAAWFEVHEIEQVISERFAGRRWDFSSEIFSDAYDVFPGMAVDSDTFRGRLARLGYSPTKGTPKRRGEYRFSSDPRRMQIYLHSFDYPSRREPGRLLDLTLDRDGRIARMVDTGDGSEIYDFSLEPALIAGLHGDHAEARREMSLDEIPTALVRAVVAVEDRRFFEHQGLDLRALGRAMLVNVRSGGVRQGGSTLTQQLMKNFFLSDDRTFKRKAREAVMALVAERRYSKLDILESYLNEIYLGQAGGTGIHGVWEAARFYFGRDPQDLTIAQIATLAGIIRAPSYYSPHRHADRASARRDVVLGLMFEQNDIDQATYERALGEAMETSPPPSRAVSAPYFVDFLRKELLGRYPREILTSEGYRVFTTLDTELQKLAETVVKKNLSELEARIPQALEDAGGQHLEAALVAINPNTGAVRAMVGGRDYGKSQFNRAIDSRRQPGSTFKPIVMLAALGSERVGAKHFLPTTKVADEKFVWEYGNETWSPSNYGDKFHGEVSVRQALERSLNAATARIAHDVGIDPIRDLAERLGMDPDIKALPAIVLGGWAVPPFDVAKVFSVFANGGMRVTPISVSKVIDRSGGLVEGHHLDLERVIPETDAYLVTHLLAGVMDRGTGAGARRRGFRHPAAGKTGTSNDYKDAWFVGYTPDLLVVVWVGFDRAASIGLAGSEAALPIWTDFMLGALEGRPEKRFDLPPAISLVEVDSVTGERAVADCTATVREAFLAGEEPMDPCSEHRRSPFGSLFQ